MRRRSAGASVRRREPGPEFRRPRSRSAGSHYRASPDGTAQKVLFNAGQRTVGTRHAEQVNLVALCKILGSGVKRVGS